MALGYYFTPKSFTKDGYDETLQRLEAAGAGAPAGRTYHFAWAGEDGGMVVFDIWESREAFEKFGETLVPIMAEVGADAGEPVVVEMHNIIAG